MMKRLGLKAMAGKYSNSYKNAKLQVYNASPTK